MIDEPPAFLLTVIVSVCISTGGAGVVPGPHGRRRLVGNPDPHQVSQPDRAADVPAALHPRRAETQVRRLRPVHWSRLHAARSLTNAFSCVMQMTSEVDAL